MGKKDKDWFQKWVRNHVSVSGDQTFSNCIGGNISVVHVHDLFPSKCFRKYFRSSIWINFGMDLKKKIFLCGLQKVWNFVSVSLWEAC